MDMASTGISDLNINNPRCAQCVSRERCIVINIETDQETNNGRLVWGKAPLDPGEVIYRHGDEFRYLYIVQSGVVRTETETIEGRLNVTGFYMPGDLFGLEGIGSDCMPGRAVANNQSRICEITYSELLAECEKNPKLQQAFIARLGQRIKTDEYKWRIIRNESASHRLFYFLVDLKKRQLHMNKDSSIVELPVEKQYISNFLGLTPESFSRTLRKLEEKGLVEKISSNRFYLPETPGMENV